MVTPRVTPFPSPPPRYRIEHRQPCRSTVLAVVTDPHPHRCTLDPFVSHLCLDGKHGAVVLVDEATGSVVARRRIERPAPGRPRPWTHPVACPVPWAESQARGQNLA